MRGFTLIELVVVIVLMAILLATAAPRFFARNDFEGPAYAQEFASAARYAQKLAVATGCPVQLVVTATDYALRQPVNANCSGGFTRAVVHPATGTDFSGTAPAGISASGPFGTITFDARGVASPAASFVLSGRTVTIAAGSGYVQVQ